MRKQLSVLEFSELTDSLFKYHFDSNGEYDPAQGHVGSLYEYYVRQLDDPSEAKSLLDFHEDLTNEILGSFEEEALFNETNYDLSFGTAYKLAKQKVYYVKDSTRQLSTVLATAIGMLGSAFSEPEKEDDK